MKIAMVASESVPLIKTGGLADVVYSLSKELTIAHEEVVIVLPYYQKIKNKNVPTQYITSYDVAMSWRRQRANVFRTYVDGMSIYLIENNRYFDRDSVYGDFDDGERFAFFALAAKELFSHINFVPDVIHTHDWHTGMLACLIKESHDPFFEHTKFVFTIHNPAFQGLVPKLCLGDFYNLPDSLFDEGKVRLKDQVSTLKAGIVYSDKITAVSPTCREELMTWEGGMGIEYDLTLRKDDFKGILNGIDVGEFNPRTDTNIATTYSLKNYLKGKQTNKQALLEEMHLSIDLNQPAYGLVSRFTWQKGMDLVFEAANTLASRGAYIILLGSGEYRYEQMAEALRARYPNNVGIYIGYNDNLAHKIYAGCDFFLMPSLFEPCGIGQMVAQTYGTLPIVRRVGGLKDTIIPYNGSNIDIADGYGFDNYSKDEINYQAHTTYNNYQNKQLHNQMVKNAMKKDNSWKKSMKEYLNLYRLIVG